MDGIKIDKRNEEDIKNQIMELAKGYTPEWYYQEKEGDAGYALSVLYAEMLYGTKEKLNQLFHKNKIEFFNQLRVDILPAKASEGYVTFGLVNEEVSGVEVERGTRVIANTDYEEHGEVFFEITEPVFVSPTQISQIYQISDQSDYIGKEEKTNEKWSLHGFRSYSPNLQAHELFICHTELFQIATNGSIEIHFYQNPYELIAEELAAKLANHDLVTIEYYSEEGYMEFEQVEVKDRIIILTKSETQPEFSKLEIHGTDSFWIVFRIKDAGMFKNEAYHRIKLKAYSDELVPQIIHGAGIQCDHTEYLPFGNRLGLYQEVVFGSDEVLGKAGAVVQLRFKLEFKKTPLETNTVSNVNWKWRMKESDFEKEPEYEITIDEVIWEYYTVNGWKRLFEDSTYMDLFQFHGQLHAKIMEIKFTVPKDIASTIVNSTASYYIRARILSINNEYKTNGYYVVPVLTETTFDYTYDSSEIFPQYIVEHHNMQMKLLKGNKTKELPFVRQMGVEERAVYLGFQTPPYGSPIKILFLLHKNNLKTPYPLKWEYYSEHGFKEINVIDETEHLKKTGIVTFTAKKDFEKIKFFNQECFWVRIIDIHHYYETEQDFAFIEGIFMNTTKAKACQSYEEQQFRISNYEINHTLTLTRGEVLSIELWVNEGIGEEKWVKWEEVGDFLDSTSYDSHYILNSYEGIITFGDGKHGRVPPVSDQNIVRAVYRTGGGAYTNVKANQISKLEKSIGFIQKISNHQPFLGGCDREQEPEAMERNAARLKHRNRAVTRRDYEEIAKECSGSIHKVTCFKHRNEYGEREAGVITLCVIQKEYEYGYLSFEELKGQIFEYMKDKVNQSLQNGNMLRIIEPVLVKISVNMQIYTDRFELVFSVKEQIKNRLKQFLHPLYGNVSKSGFEISEIPDVVQIKNAVYDVEGLSGISQISLLYCLCKGEEEKEIDLDMVRKYPYILIIEGAHNINISGGNNA